jgi:hypothetical protein
MLYRMLMLVATNSVEEPLKYKTPAQHIEDDINAEIKRLMDTKSPALRVQTFAFQFLTRWFSMQAVISDKPSGQGKRNTIPVNDLLACPRIRLHSDLAKAEMEKPLHARRHLDLLRQAGAKVKYSVDKEVNYVSPFLAVRTSNVIGVLSSNLKFPSRLQKAAASGDTPDGAVEDTFNVSKGRLIIQVAYYHCRKNLKMAEYAVTENNTLAHLRSKFYCIHDQLVDYNSKNAGFFFFEHTFYDDVHGLEVDEDGKPLEKKEELHRYSKYGSRIHYNIYLFFKKKGMYLTKKNGLYFI